MYALRLLVGHPQTGPVSGPALKGGSVKPRYTIDTYEARWQEDPDAFGAVPVEQALASLGMDMPTLSMLMDKGVISGFEIGDASGDRTLVSLRSLLTFKKARSVSAPKDRPQQILAILIDAARRATTLSFGDVMEELGMRYADAMQRKWFRKDLREATRQSELFSQGLLISALLVFRIQYIPDDDFFLMAQEEGLFTPGKDSKTVFFKNQTERIFAFYKAPSE
jgi:hypothetical protein